MKKVLFALMCAVILFGTIAIGYADSRDWHGTIRSRIHEAKQDIRRGIELGTLTRHEARKLNEELDDILDKIERMKRDGHLSRSEREKIDDNLDRLDKHIRKEKRDDDRRADTVYWHRTTRSRIHEAKQSIQRGIEHGTLTRHEARKLNEELDDILDKIGRMKRDGRLSRSEREKIDDNLDRLDKHIRKEKRDDDRR